MRSLHQVAASEIAVNTLLSERVSATWLAVRYKRI